MRVIASAVDDVVQSVADKSDFSEELKNYVMMVE